MQLPFFAALKEAQRILIAGCGGGFDIYSGLPLHAYLTAAGKTVHLASLSFARLNESGCSTIDGKAWVIDATARELDYFPERYLVEWFARQGREVSVIGFLKTGVMPLEAAYNAVVSRLAIDTVILIDGGTDSIIKGDEPGLGTVVEDATSLVAVNEIDVPRKLLACLGFGVDHFHGVSHHSYLENTAELIRAGAFRGCCSLTLDMPEARSFLDAVDYANMRQPAHRSIVCNSIAGALRGEFGDYHATDRTGSAELFINPLMTLYWFYDIPAVAHWVGFYDAIRFTTTPYQVWDAIHQHREQIGLRPRRLIPL
jgi:hypothetical protein